MKTNREISFDLLRLLAILAVIVVHACSSGTPYLDASDSNHQILTFIAALMTWQVPVFVMISGRFFLDPSRNITFSRILKKYIPRIIICFLAWDVIYQFYYVMTGAYADLNWKGVLSQFIIGPYHFWYLWMLVCLYLITPFLRSFTNDKKIMEYYAFLFLIGEFFVCYGSSMPVFGEVIGQILAHANYSLTLGYSGYFIIGYYLYKYPVSKKTEYLVYVLGLMCLIFTGTASVWDSVHMHEHKDFFSRYLTPNVIAEATAIYLFFVKHLAEVHISERGRGIIGKLAEMSFGVYLIHGLVLDLFSAWCPVKTVTHPILGILILLAGCVIISNLIVYVLKKIPIIAAIVS